MIVSHRYKFIFIKTSKAAGTSLEIALSQYCDDGDIVTPISKKDEATRQALGYQGPRHYREPLGELALGAVAPLANHSGAKHARKFLGEKVWCEYFKFCVVRNPWDRFLSFYHWRYPSEHRPSATDVLVSTEANKLIKLGYELYTQDGEVLVDQLLRYENLGAEIKQLAPRLGLPGPLQLPLAKGSHRPKSSCVDDLSLSEKLMIQKLCEREIRLLGYSFPL